MSPAKGFFLVVARRSPDGRHLAGISAAKGRRAFAIVPVDHTEDMAAELKKAGRPVATLLLPDADHCFQAGPDRLARSTAIEQFLGAHLN